MDEAAWPDVAQSQSGLITRAQLRSGGVTEDQLRWRLGRSWRLVLPSVVDVRGEAQLSASRQNVAAALEGGPQSVVSGHRACLWHGLGTARGNRPVLVLVGPSQTSRDVGFAQLRRTRRPDELAQRSGPIRIASRAPAVADAARQATNVDEAAGLLIEAVQRRMVSLPQLMHEVESAPRKGSAIARSALRLAESGAWSIPEAEVLWLCAASRVLPHAWPNPELELADGTSLISPDVWFDDVGMAVMVHSRAHHLRDEDWEGTVEQDGRLTESGVLVVGFTPRSIQRDGAQVLRRIERTYLSARVCGRLRPGVRMIPRRFGIAQ